MSDESRIEDGALAGLVGREAEQLYARLLRVGALEIGTSPDQVSCQRLSYRYSDYSRLA